jgi:pimeloyl-ACP methyl ester carboxylesterase
MKNTSSYFVEVNGLRLHYVRSGSGQTLVLLHGWPEWSHVWRPVMPRHANEFDLVAPDFRGFGDSQKTSSTPARDATPDALAADTLALANALGLERIGLVAHDVGDFVAQVIARRVPERITGLFFFNCAYPDIGARWVEPGHLLETWYQFFHQMPWVAKLIGPSRGACRIYIHAFLRHWAYRQDALDDELEVWVDNFMKPGNLQGGFNRYLSNHASRMAVIEGVAPLPPPIGIPTRVFWGEHDPLLKGSWTDRLPGFFTDLEFSFAPEAGHSVHYETPDRASEENRRFFHRGASDGVFGGSARGQPGDRPPRLPAVLTHASGRPSLSCVSGLTQNKRGESPRARCSRSRSRGGGQGRHCEASA